MTAKQCYTPNRSWSRPCVVVIQEVPIIFPRLPLVQALWINPQRPHSLPPAAPGPGCVTSNQTYQFLAVTADIVLGVEQIIKSDSAYARAKGPLRYTVCQPTRFIKERSRNDHYSGTDKLSNPKLTYGLTCTQGIGDTRRDLPHCVAVAQHFFVDFVTLHFPATGNWGQPAES